MPPPLACVDAHTAQPRKAIFVMERQSLRMALWIPVHLSHLLEDHMNYEERDTYGMYKVNPNGSAGADGSGVDSSRADTRGPGPALMGADTLIGYDVYNQQDEDLGDIQEIMLDTRNGRICYAVLSFGGFLGMGEKLFAVPWNALTLDSGNKRFVLNVDKEHLKNAPGFDKDAWPDMADKTWADDIHAYYGTKPYPQDTHI
jgi:sporulation protein YlmC with PRC-barrel domain